MVRLKLGILGGTFDPPHIGHLLLAEFAQYALALHKVLFVPAGDPPHKDSLRTASAHRLAMLELATAENAVFAISRIDLDRPGPHYTVDTLKLLTAHYPSAELYFIMGADSFRDLLTWSRPAELITLARLAVVQRPGIEIHPAMHHRQLPQLAERTFIIDAPLIGVSSTDVVRWLRAGAPVGHLLPTGVNEYIQTHRLYR